MANLPQVSMLGPEGQPPLKKPRIDSDSGECTGQYFLKFVERGFGWDLYS